MNRRPDFVPIISIRLNVTEKINNTQIETNFKTRNDEMKKKKNIPKYFINNNKCAIWCVHSEATIFSLLEAACVFNWMR